MSAVTWREVAVLYPEFVAWAAQTHGPLPEVVTAEDYARLSAEYWATYS